MIFACDQCLLSHRGVVILLMQIMVFPCKEVVPQTSHETKLKDLKSRLKKDKCSTNLDVYNS